MLFFHFIVNVGMVMGIMPITGIPLPFLSYGGSALMTNMIAMGLLMSINSRQLDFKTTL
jgi:rod shape determining protein RodA